MKLANRVSRKLPWLKSLYLDFVDRNTRRRLQNKEAEQIFTEIYEQNFWKGAESISGTGSDLRQTERIVLELPRILREYSIKSVMDVPCGDFNWMKHVDLGDVQYLGGDIVAGLITNNAGKYASATVNFVKCDLLTDNLPCVDLIICRDCFVHFSFEDIGNALAQIGDSRSAYLLTTTFTEKENKDIATGQWRPINLQSEPFLFPEPLQLIKEDCTEGDGAHRDKSLGLWRIEDLPSSVV